MDACVRFVSQTAGAVGGVAAVAPGPCRGLCFIWEGGGEGEGRSLPAKGAFAPFAAAIRGGSRGPNRKNAKIGKKCIFRVDGNRSGT